MNQQLQVVTVDPHEVEQGDVLVGNAGVVSRTIYDGHFGYWVLLSPTGRVIRRLSPDQRVQVWRGTLTDDDCPPWGIPRPMEAVR